MKPFIILTGPQAVGKMAVGKALKENYNYRLFHNHMSIELVIEIFGSLNPKNKEVVKGIRQLVFDAIPDQDLEGFVFTFTWAFDRESDHHYIQSIIDQFHGEDYQVFIVELEASLETRLKRNNTPLRLKEKASKRDVEWSENDIKRSMEIYRLNSHDGEIDHVHYMKINNEELSVKETAEKIRQYITENIGS